MFSFLIVKLTKKASFFHRKIVKFFKYLNSVNVYNNINNNQKDYNHKKLVLLFTFGEKKIVVLIWRNNLSDGFNHEINKLIIYMILCS